MSQANGSGATWGAVVVVVVVVWLTLWAGIAIVSHHEPGEWLRAVARVVVAGAVLLVGVGESVVEAAAPRTAAPLNARIVSRAFHEYIMKYPCIEREFRRFIDRANHISGFNA